MKNVFLRAMSGVAVSLVLVQAGVASMPACHGSPRWVGPFGAMNPHAPKVSVPARVRSQLPHLVAIRQVLQTHLSPGGEEAIVYDTDEDQDPHPHLAFVVGGKVVKDLNGDEAAGDGTGGFLRLLAACEFGATENDHGLAVAFSSAGDGAGSAFAIVMWRGGSYRVVFKLHGGQARLVLAERRLTLWDSRGDGECVWCPQRYEIKRYIWRDGGYVKAGVARLKRRYDPGAMSGVALRTEP